MEELNIVEQKYKYIDEEIDNENVKNAFKMFKLHFPWMLDRIPIDYKYLDGNYWDIDYVMTQYWELFYYNTDVFDDNMSEQIQIAEKKYSALLSDVLTCDSTLYKLLMRLSEEKNNRLYIDKTKKSSVKDLICDDKYDFLSPKFVVEIYKENIKRDKQNHLKETIKQLDEHVKKVDIRYKKFRIELILLCRKYILNMPINSNNIQKYQTEHIKNMHICILSVCLDLIDLNVLTFNYLIDDFIMEKLSLYEIIMYDPDQNEDRKIIMI